MPNIESPECDRLVAAAEDSHKIGDFLDWLNAQGILLAKMTDFDELDEPVLAAHHERYEDLLARYFEIDLDKVERERRAILDSLRAQHA